MTQQTIAFWFKTSSHKNNACLFYTKSQYDSSSLALYERYIIGRYCLEVVVTDSSGNSHVVLTTLSHDINPEEIHFALNKWNFIALTCCVEQKNGTKALNVELQVNALHFNKKLNEFSSGWDLRGPNLEMNFGYIYCPQNADNQLSNTYDNCEFTLIAIGNRKRIAADILLEYFRKTEDYIADNALTEEDDISDCSITHLIKTNSVDFGSFKVFPLENNLFSLNYNPASPNSADMPAKFDLRKGYTADKDTAFNFDKQTKKYAFVADGNRLSYKARLGGSGTVAASVIFDDIDKKQYIFDIKSSVSRISLLKDGTDNQLCFVVDNNGTKDVKWINWWPVDHYWHDIALSFDRRIQTGYFGSTYSHYVRVMSDGNVVFEQEFTNISLMDDVEIMIGRSFTIDPDNSNSSSEGIKYSALFGRVSNFAYNNAYNSKETINGLFEKFKHTSKLTHYNEFGAPVKEEIINNGNAIYYRKSNWTTSLYSEVISVGGQEESRDYSYDKLNNLTYIYTSNGEYYHYNYDYNGFLLHEEYSGPNKNYWLEYTYDSNGNILSRTNDIIHDTFAYAGDRLVSYNNRAVEYDQNNAGNIRSLDGWTFNYEGRRLVEAICMVTPAGQIPYGGGQSTKQGNVQKLRVSFQYNDKGLRTYKSVQLYEKVVGGYRFISEVLTAYQYDGNNLVYEKTGNRELFYLYDENKELYGYILNNQKYFYIKDSFKNILGVINGNGNVVARYIYDAYGNLISSEGSIYNPIRYKGYYFDNETGFFYCKSRYYVPKLCRWLNIDSPAFLKVDDVTKMNLFAYCHCNPVMYCDPDGNMPKWLAWILSGTAIAVGIVLSATGVGGILGGVLIGAGAGSLIGGYINEANGGSFDAGYIGGAISGALCGVGAGLGGMALVAATEASNLACIGLLGVSIASSFAGGFVGSIAGNVYTNFHDNGFKKLTLDPGEMFASAAISGALNIFAGFAAGTGSVVGGVGKAAADVNTKVAAGILSGLIAGGTEFVYDLASYLISLFM